MAIDPSGVCAVTTILSAVSTGTVFLRFYVRRLKTVKVGTDDWTVLAAMIGLWGVFVTIIVGAFRGLFGTHTAMNPETGASILTWKDRRNVEYTWIVMIITIATLTLVKLSVVFLYRRIFDISRIFNVYSIILCILLIVCGIGFTFATIFQCGTRPAAFWTSAKAHMRYCDHTEGGSVAFSISDLILDVMILSAPAPMIWKLRLDTVKKLQILAVFGLGLLSTAGSAVRLYIMVMSEYHTTPGYRDLVAGNTKVVIWSLIEIAAAIIGSCLPIFKPLFPAYSERTFISSIRFLLWFPAGKTEPFSPKTSPDDAMALRSFGGTEFISAKG